MEENAEGDVRLPRGNEVIGTVTKILGASRFMVMCSDSKERLCSIPGKFKRMFWIKVNDVVLVRPWAVEADEKGDIIWRYSIMAANKLRHMNLLK